MTSFAMAVSAVVLAEVTSFAMAVAVSGTDVIVFVFVLEFIFAFVFSSSDDESVSFGGEALPGPPASCCCCGGAPTCGADGFIVVLLSPIWTHSVSSSSYFNRCSPVNASNC